MNQIEREREMKPTKKRIRKNSRAFAELLSALIGEDIFLVVKKRKKILLFFVDVPETFARMQHYHMLPILVRIEREREECCFSL